MAVPFVHSNYQRKAGDFYPTLDPRCVWGFLEHYTPTGPVVDVCAPAGSGIVTELANCGIIAACGSDAFAEVVPAQWIVTNPPYDRALVDGIINRQIKRVDSEQVYGLAVLLRATFDHAKSRRAMFQDNRLYAGQIKLLFRPWWSDSRKKQPIHNYVWQIWTQSAVITNPIVMFASGVQPNPGKGYKQ